MTRLDKLLATKLTKKNWEKCIFSKNIINFATQNKKAQVAEW